MSTIETNLVQPSTGTTLTLGAASDVIQIPASAEIDIASGATLDVNGTIDLTGATKTGFPTSGLNLITSVTNNASVTSIDFTDCFSATYRVYYVVIAALPVASAEEIRAVIGNSDFSSTDTFQNVLAQWDVGSNFAYRVSTGVAYIDLNNTGGAGEPPSIQFTLFNPFSSVERTQLLGQSSYYQTSGGTYSLGQLASMSDGTVSRTSLRLNCSSGNLGSSSYTARVSIYGLGES
jgi:hypothetical protein